MVTVLVSDLRDLFLRTGYADVIGGVAVFDSGLADLRTGSLVVAAELVKAEQLRIDLSDAVVDGENFPHLTNLHGLLDDALVAEVPAELRPWVERMLAMGPFPQSAEIARAVTRLAVSAPNVFHRALCRLALFESFCLQERFLLRASGVQLETLNGRRRDIEILADAEMQAACELVVAADGLLTVEDPGVTLTRLITTSLAQHVAVLQRELGLLSREVHEVLERRRQLLAVLEHLDADDAVIMLNASEDTTGEERLAPSQLRARHPMLLGDLSDDAIYQRVARMPTRVRRKKRGKSLLDLILETTPEVLR